MSVGSCSLWSFCGRICWFFWGLVAVLDTLWCVDTSLQSFFHLAFSSVSVSEFPFSYKDINHWIKTHPNSVCPHLNLIMSTNPYFQIKSHSQVPGLRLEHIFFSDTSQPTTQGIFGNKNSVLVPSICSLMLQSLEAWELYSSESLVWEFRLILCQEESFVQWSCYCSCSSSR